jgi:hypothetical protein
MLPSLGQSFLLKRLLHPHESKDFRVVCLQNSTVLFDGDMRFPRFLGVVPVVPEVKVNHDCIGQPSIPLPFALQNPREVL